jgi:hypothetical protein
MNRPNGNKVFRLVRRRRDHGFARLTVICGEILEHVRCEHTDPAVFAEALLRRMLPPKTPE